MEIVCCLGEEGGVLFLFCVGVLHDDFHGPVAEREACYSTVCTRSVHILSVSGLNMLYVSSRARHRSLIEDDVEEKC